MWSTATLIAPGERNEWKHGLVLCGCMSDITRLKSRLLQFRWSVGGTDGSSESSWWREDSLTQRSIFSLRLHFHRHQVHECGNDGKFRVVIRIKEARPLSARMRPSLLNWINFKYPKNEASICADSSRVPCTASTISATLIDGQPQSNKLVFVAEGWLIRTWSIISICSLCHPSSCPLLVLPSTIRNNKPWPRQENNGISSK